MVVRESLARDFFRLIVWYPLRWLVKLVPIRYGFAIFRVMGDMHYHLSRNKRNVIMKNLQSAFGDNLTGKKLLDIVRNYFRNHYINQLQIFLFPRFNRNNIERFHTFEGLENLDNALKKGKGCILIHPHFGPAQLPLCALGIIGYPMMQLGLPTDEGLSFIGKRVAFRLRLKYESRIPARIVSANSFLRPIMEWLKNNNVLMMTGDGAGGGKFIGRFVPVEFCGKPILFPMGAATLAQNMDTSLLPMFTVLLEDGIYKTFMHKPINYYEGDKKGENMETYTTIFAKKMEHYVYEYPYLWHFWDEWADRIAKEDGSINRAKVYG